MRDLQRAIARLDKAGIPLGGSMREAAVNAIRRTHGNLFSDADLATWSDATIESLALASLRKLEAKRAAS